MIFNKNLRFQAMCDRIGVPAGSPQEVIVWSCENEAYSIVDTRILDEAEKWISATESSRQWAEPIQETDACEVKLTGWTRAEWTSTFGAHRMSSLVSDSRPIAVELW